MCFAKKTDRVHALRDRGLRFGEFSTVVNSSQLEKVLKKGRDTTLSMAHT
jgi:hypothetical protein